MTYSPDTKDKVCRYIASGLSLREIGAIEGMPGKSTVLGWLAEDEGFSDQYARARQAQAELYAEEIIEIADDATNDWMERRDDKGGVGYELNGEHIQRSRLRVDSRKWVAAKLLPKKYGDKVTQEVTGKDGEDLIPKTDNRELAKAIVSVLGKAKLTDEAGE